MLGPTASDSMPAWKASLLEKRRRQQQIEKGPGVPGSGAPGTAVDEATAARLAQMPAWKREIYLKKYTQNGDDGTESRGPAGRTTVREGHPRPSSEVRDLGMSDFSSDDDLSDSERLIPIQRNPILQSDIRRRPPQATLPVENPKHPVENPKHSISSSTVSIGNGISSSSNRSRSNKKSKGGHRNFDTENDVSEVTYGRGFVSKLLGRFRELSEKNHSLSRGSNLSKRAVSSENLFETVDNDIRTKGNASLGGGLKYSKVKAQSMENLHLSSSDKLESGSRRGRPLSILNGLTSILSNSKPNAKQTLNKTSGTVPKSVEPVSRNHKEISLKENSLSAPVTIVRASSPVPEDEMPRSNIVLMTRTVFESIATSPPIDLPNSKSKPFSIVRTKTDDRKSYVNSPQNGRSFEHDETDARVSRDVQDSAKPARITNNLDAHFQDHRDLSLNRNGVPSNNMTETGSDRYTAKLLPGQSEKSSIVSNHSDNSSIKNKALASSFNGTKSDDRIRNGYIVEKGSYDKSSQPQVDPPKKSEPTRQVLISDLKDLPTDIRASAAKSDRSHSSGDSRSSISKFDVDAASKKGQGRGSLLIRPASNLLSSSTKVEYLNLTKYNDVKTGEFPPPKQRPSYYDDEEDDTRNPAGDFDDSTDNAGYSPKEGDPTLYGNRTPVLEFEGAGVRFGRSLLEKTRSGKQLGIHFDEAADVIFEYPSEQTMIEHWIDADSDDESDEDDSSVAMIESNSTLKSTPGINNTGSLSSYKSRLQVDYQIGVERPADENEPAVAPSSQAASDVSDSVVPATGDESVLWSNSDSNDLLF